MSLCVAVFFSFFVKYPATTGIYTYVPPLSLHDAPPISKWRPWRLARNSLTDSRGWQVASEIAVIAIGQAAWASSFIVPQKPQASFWKVGICLVVVIVFSFGLIVATPV